jgi:transcriptional regulator with XRE-family HTH domain
MYIETMKTGPIDRRFAKIIREAREASGLSQSQLAAFMAGYGFPWRQQTVTCAENGERSVSIGEAVALAVILHLDIELSKLGAELPQLCGTCRGNPATGFTCNTCGRSGA